MAKQIQITDADTKKTYTLEFTRDTVRAMERQGFLIGGLFDKGVSTIPELFAGAFLKNHRFLKREVIDKIFAQLRDKSGLISALADMYNDTLRTLLDDPEEDEGNVSWTEIG